MMDAEKVEKVASGLERLTKSSNCPFVVYDAVSVISELKAENERLRQEKDDAVTVIEDLREEIKELRVTARG